VNFSDLVQGGASARNFLGGGLAAEGPVRLGCHFSGGDLLISASGALLREKDSVRMMQQDQIRN
jgi:hypothetical protein